MKTEISKRRQPTGSFWVRAALAAATLGLLMGEGAETRAAVVLDTLGGGPLQGFPTAAGSKNGNTFLESQFNVPSGLALNSAGTTAYIADFLNDEVRRVSQVGDTANSFTSTFVTNNGVSRPVAVAVDGANRVYVLNRGNGNNGTVLLFNSFGNLLGTKLANLTNATAIALDSSTNIYVTVRSNVVIRVSGTATNTVGVIANAGTYLKGIAVLDTGLLALTDAGNHGVWRLDPANGSYSTFTGFNGAGDAFGDAAFAQFKGPEMIAKAGGGMLVVADRGNHRVKVIDSVGTVVNLYGVSSNSWYFGEGAYPGWWDGEVCEEDQEGCPEARDPVGVAVGPDGAVYSTEVYYHLFRRATDTGLVGPAADVPPTITTQPAPIQSVDLGGTVSFSVLATGTEPFTYQWRFGGTAIPGATQSSYTRSSVAAGDAGNYSVIVANGGGSVTSSNALLIVNLPPSITSHPQSQNVALGDNATFVVSASGTAPLGFQWRYNGVSIVGATQNSYTRVNVQPADGGNYSVVVTNAVGSATSSNAVLTVASPPVIIAQPQDQVVRLNTNASFTVTAVGAEPLTYQWRLNGTNLPGAVFTNLTRLNVQISDAGDYSVVVVNPYGSVTSSIATLEILDPPSFAPNFGYYPMGRIISVQSGSREVRYTTDGTEPNLNSPRVEMTGSSGSIRWASSTNDLTFLRVRGFIGTNASVTVGGRPAPTNSVGVPPGLSGSLLAGIGSKIVVPIVADLRTNDSVKSFIFRVEVTANGAAPMISDQFDSLSVTSNDFIRVVTAAREGAIGTYNVQPYAVTNDNQKIRGLSVSAIGTNANISFQHYGIVAMVAIPIPENAVEGQTYTVTITNSSATSDGGQTAVAFPAKAAATIIVTNVPYAVGDSAVGGWYNAGDFGNLFLDNADVNSAFYAASGLRIPYAFSDVYDSMDAWPEDDEADFLGGDGELSYLDWQVTLQRALGLVQTNWLRAWSPGGVRANLGPIPAPGSVSAQGGESLVSAPWDRQALVGAKPVGSATPGTLVNVPIYVRTAHGANVRGFQFTCYLNPNNGAPALAGNPAFFSAVGVGSPNQLTTEPNNLACGWSLDSVNFGSHTSNYLGTVRFTIPGDAVPGQTYTISFDHAGGARDFHTPYSFETKRATIYVATPAAAGTDPTSDDWKQYFFSSLTAPDAAPNADGDFDGVPNWAEYLAGTDPTQAGSVLQFDSTTTQFVSGQRQVILSWLSAPGKLYEVLGGDTSGSVSSSVLGTVLGDGTVKQFIDTNPGSPRFYRLRVQP